MEHALQPPTADPAWVIEQVGFDPLCDSSCESRFAVSNGFLGVRAAPAINRSACALVPPRTYVAGLFDTVGIGQPIPGLIPVADWLKVYISLPGWPLVEHADDVSSRRRTLDMHRGALLTAGRQLSVPGVSIRVRMLRLVSLSERAVGLQLIQLDTEAGEVDVVLEASFDGLEFGLKADRIEQGLGVWHTNSSGKRLAMAAASSLLIDGRVLTPAALGPFGWRWSWRACPGQSVCFDRIVAVARSDVGGEDPGSGASDKLGAARALGWRGVLDGHEAAWAQRWQCSDVEVDGDPAAQQALRFAVYHLNSAVNPADESVSVAARALTGGDYRGHVFWDTEIYLLPFYTLTWPEAARALLMYRFHTLDGARAKAAGMGWRGALYAWESADTGAETTPEHVIGPDRRVVEVLCGTQEQHISADVAYAVWQYWEATGDEAFLLRAGAEMLLETARFWSSRAQLEADGQRHIRGVIGPDEYHEHIDDNAFTNVMARWNIRRALEVAALLRERWPDSWAGLSSRLALDDAELAQWRAAADTMATGLDPETGLFEQFAGFFALDAVDLAHYAGRSVPMDVVLGRKRTARSQVVKQADVVALLGLLPEAFAGGAGAANFDYYEPRCSHGSSLSRAMHGLVAARLGRTEMALQYFRQTADIDLAETHVAIDGGVHIAALGGIWLTAVCGFAGLSLRADGVALDPRLPAGWRRLGFAVQWRGRHLKVSIEPSKETLEAALKSGEPMTLHVSGTPHELRRGQPLRVRIGKEIE